MNLANMDDSHTGAPSADKRRSKLGYHRTSVACVHCRRRKIRCLPAEKDPQGRCQNCIRLKKECQYNPVEHPPPNERPQPTHKKSGLDDPSSSISSSPAPTTPSAVNGLDQFGFPSGDPAHQTFATAMGTGQDSTNAMAPPFPFGTPARHHTWTAGYGDETMNDSTYPVTPNRFPTATRAMSVGGPQGTFHDQQTGLPWVPTRSASFGGMSDMSQQYPLPDVSQQPFNMPYHYPNPAALGGGGSVPQSPASINVMSMNSSPGDAMMSPYAFSPGWVPTTGSTEERSRSFGGPWMQ